jgi:indolepyruvate ferredoxin oxidoreductase
MQLLARGRVLRGTVLDPFGHTAERRTERGLIDAFERRIDEMLPTLGAEKLSLATQLAAVPLSIRGFGHVKLGNLALARVREAELLHRLDPERHPAPPRSGPPPAGQLRGIQVVARV